jgi:hypothetical protein
VSHLSVFSIGLVGPEHYATYFDVKIALSSPFIEALQKLCEARAVFGRKLNGSRVLDGHCMTA